jgi:tellurite resistance protein TerA
VQVPGEPDMTIVPAAHDGKLAVCAVASLENVRDGIKMTNHTEYFAGHAEMDRAFGYGILWHDGRK